MNMKISNSAQKAIEILTAAGYEAFCVGGCVRDIIILIKMGVQNGNKI